MSQLAATEVVTAATHLMRAGQWSAATDLLTAAATDDPAERAVLALAQAEVAVDQDFGHPTDHAAGELAQARTQWERSTELFQKVGHLRPALAQQALLAVLLRDEGDVTGSRALATEVNRWARQLGIPFIIQETAELMA